MESAVFLGIDIQTVWYILIGIMFTVYWIADGFSSGSGIIYMFLKNPGERKYAVNVSGPFRNANEIWLLLGIASVIAIFPPFYAAVLSGFYVPVTLWCLCLVVRKASSELRGRLPGKWWGGLWDILYSLSCFSSIMIAGLIISKILTGVPLDHNLNIEPEFLSIITPFNFAVSILVLLVTILHGALFFALKTQGGLYSTSVNTVKQSIRLCLIAFPAVYVYIFNHLADMDDIVWERPWIAVITALTCLNMIFLYFKIRQRGYLWAFWLSCLNMCLMSATAACVMFPNLAASTLHPDYTITIYNSASSPAASTQLQSAAIAILPFIFLYSIISHWTFRGKTRLDENSF